MRYWYYSRDFHRFVCKIERIWGEKFAKGFRQIILYGSCSHMINSEWFSMISYHKIRLPSSRLLCRIAGLFHTALSYKIHSFYGKIIEYTAIDTFWKDGIEWQSNSTYCVDYGIFQKCRKESRNVFFFSWMKEWILQINIQVQQPFWILIN